jgi:RNA polymerase-binding transcription factor
MESIERVLQQKRDRLEAELAELSAPPEASSGISFGKRVGEGTSMAVDRLVQVAAHDKKQLLLADVRRAIVKLAEGTYGACDICGDDISSERLDALPWATVCIGCANRR